MTCSIGLSLLNNVRGSRASDFSFFVLFVEEEEDDEGADMNSAPVMSENDEDDSQKSKKDVRLHLHLLLSSGPFKD